jgi:tight adherence protein C
MFVCICVIVLLGAMWLQGQNPEQRRLQAVLAGGGAVERTARADMRWRERSAALANKLRRTLGMRESQQIRVRLIAAGLRGSHASDMFFGMRCLTPLLGGFLGSFMPNNTGFWIFALALTGYMAPDVWLTMKTKKRKDTIRRGLPDAVDLLVICVDAGLGLDQALLRVGQELAISHPEINQEFMQVHFEQRAGKARLEAWQSLADRTGVDELAAFVSMLTQTDRFGTPILRALSRFSEELRLKRRQHAEQAAAKTKIKIIFPLVLFIFPCIFIVLLAPAVINIADGLKVMAK